VILGLGWMYLVLFAMNFVWTVRSFQGGHHRRVRLFGLLDGEDGHGHDVPLAGFWALYTVILGMVALAHFTNYNSPSGS
jgi:hypothetical protein